MAEDTAVKTHFSSKNQTLDIITNNNNRSNEKDYLSVGFDGDSSQMSTMVISAANVLSNSKQVHPLKKPYQCDLCPKTFTKPFYLNLHRKVHLKPPKIYECFQCNKIFPTSGKLSTHERAVHKDKVHFSCDQCNQVFNLFRAYVSHQKSHSNAKPLMCDLCDKPFAYSSQLTAHMRVHTGERPFQCQLCKKKFTYSGHLTVHMRSHTGDRPYKCETCKKSFTQSSDLTHHSKIHSGIKPHTCGVCSKSFTHAGQLIVHLRKHSGEKPYRCEHCHKRFAQSSHLTLHIRSHTGEKPYRCGRCDKSFVDSSHLAVHTRTHTGEKPFKCPFPGCGGLFSRSSQLARHRRFCHFSKNKAAVCEKKRPYRCTFCPRTFSAENHLDCHTQTHVNEKHHACQYCQKRIYKSSNLDAHKQTHKGTKKPYQCPEYLHTFSHSNYLATHQKNIHKISKAFSTSFLFMANSNILNADNIESKNKEEIKEKKNKESSSSSSSSSPPPPSSSSSSSSPGRPLIQLTPFSPIIYQPNISSIDNSTKEEFTESIVEFSNGLFKNETKENKITSMMCNNSRSIFSDTQSHFQSLQDNNNIQLDQSVNEEEDANANRENHSKPKDNTFCQMDSPQSKVAQITSPKEVSLKKPTEVNNAILFNTKIDTKEKN